ncbi:hypothetical protein [Leptospira santarosai]|uniref:Guanylate cyclase domain-containing protein n=1 Tax=Leptospira santarosai str. MOR084 TaxID=1049984 RepID=A0A0E2BFW0_9LEPT|nr:hypothetical protein [Leptospira santarosai]EKO34195.1 hypothetical protein LEP1GSC179_0702 [Leptospira santarosai str. MOR084]
MEYKNCLLTYIDILGFKNLIESSKNPKLVYDALTKLSTESDRESDAFSDWVHALGVKYESFKFSDLIVRLYQFKNAIEEENKYHILAYELENLAKIQRELPSHNFLIRGAVTYGQIYIENEIIFGPALVNAYQLECNVADYPRIILDKNLGEELFQMVQEITEIEPENREIPSASIFSAFQFLKKDSNKDDYYYINYPNYSVEDFEYNLVSEEIFFQEHRDLIVSVLRTEVNQKIIRKYEWLKNFHNNAYRKAKERGLISGNYEI